MAGFEQADAQLAGVAQQQFDLRAAVNAGELWMDADVAERAAARCDQAVRELDDWLIRARKLTVKRKFGDMRTATRPRSGSSRPAMSTSRR